MNHFRRTAGTLKTQLFLALSSSIRIFALTVIEANVVSITSIFSSNWGKLIEVVGSINSPVTLDDNVLLYMSSNHLLGRLGVFPWFYHLFIDLWYSRFHNSLPFFSVLCTCTLQNGIMKRNVFTPRIWVLMLGNITSSVLQVYFKCVFQVYFSQFYYCYVKLNFC